MVSGGARSPLPIDAELGAVAGAVERARAAVLVAPPGAGKTTRVPEVVTAAVRGDVVVVEPRRVAARLAAHRIAAERGERVGGHIGYEVRFERRASADTRIRFVTEGVLTRRLIGDPELAGVGAVILDEFHERGLSADLALALCRRLQRGARPDLAVVVMSATLEPEPVAAFLGDCPIVVSEGREHPVDVSYLPPERGRAPLGPLVARAAAAAAREDDGHVLAFLPGAAEIRRAAEACEDLGERLGLDVLPLHGGLSSADQDRAVAPQARRKLILATNVAETSITIDGVTAVIDSGLARVARHAPWSGIASLRVEPVSRASAAQRAGRAGRTRPGRCVRLYSRHDHDTRRPFDPPEIARADLAEVALALRGAGLRRVDELSWLESPPAPAAAAAEALLADLGAVDRAGALTDTGRRMLRFPVHPRLARVLVEAEDRGVARPACRIAALAAERDPRRGRRGPGPDASGPSDLLALADALAAATDGSSRAMREAGLDPAVARAALRSENQLARAVDADRAAAPARGRDEDRALQIAILAGYPDRVARRRGPGSRELVFAGGGGAKLSPQSCVLEAEFLVAVDAEARGRGAEHAVTVASASAIEPDWLLDVAETRVEEVDALEWNRTAERVERVRALRFGALVLDEARDPEAARREPERAGAILADAVRRAGLGAAVDTDALARWRRRVAFVARELPDAGVEPVTHDEIDRALGELCRGLVSFAELRQASLSRAIASGRPAGERSLIDRMAPEVVRLPRRRRVPVAYEDDRPPWIASRLQDFFGMDEGPRVAGGKVPLVLHLLAPNRRAVQVTTDLAGFWRNHYPSIRRELRRRYPKHDWPE